VFKGIDGYVYPLWKSTMAMEKFQDKAAGIGSVQGDQGMVIPNIFEG
jgi:hypothetical protein